MRKTGNVYVSLIYLLLLAGIVPGESLDDDLQTDMCVQLVKKLPGYDSLDKVCEIKVIGLGNWSLQEYTSILTYVHYRLGSPVSEARWYIPTVVQEPQNDCNQFLSAFKQVNDRVSATKWLMEWLHSDTCNSIEAQIAGYLPNALSETEKSMDNTAWRHAALNDDILYEVLLRRKGNWFSTIYFNDTDSRALITVARNGRGRTFVDNLMRATNPIQYKRSLGVSKYPNHWLDTIEVFYHPTNEIPSYAVVDTSGNFYVNKKPQ